VRRARRRTRPGRGWAARRPRAEPPAARRGVYCTFESPLARVA
jgi:hypothetical protein